MSWDKWTQKFPCLCGNGEFEVLYRENDWSKHEEYYKMLCPECEKKYKYVYGGELDKKGMKGDKGWVLKSVLKEEEIIKSKNLKHQKEVEDKAKKLYFQVWESKFKYLKTKKHIWVVLTVNGKHPPSLSMFYSRVKGFSLEEVVNYVNSYFNYSNILRILEICNIENPQWSKMSLYEEETSVKSTL